VNQRSITKDPQATDTHKPKAQQKFELSAQTGEESTGQRLAIHPQQVVFSQQTTATWWYAHKHNGEQERNEEEEEEEWKRVNEAHRAAGTQYEAKRGEEE